MPLARFLTPKFDAPNDKGSQLTRDEVEALIRNKLGEGANDRSVRMLSDLTEKLARTEVERDGLRDQLEKTAVPEGAVVLTGEDATAYAALKTRYDADPVKSAVADLEAHGEVSEELTRLRQSDAYRRAAEAEGLVAAHLEKYFPGRSLEVAEHEADGQKSQRAFVVMKNGDETEKTLLSDFLANEHAELVPVLRAEEPPVKPSFPKMPASNPGNPAPPSDPVAAHVERLNARNGHKTAEA